MLALLLKILHTHHYFCYNVLKCGILFIVAVVSQCCTEGLQNFKINEVAGLKAEKAKLEEKCFPQEIEIELTQTNTDQVGENANFSE